MNLTSQPSVAISLFGTVILFMDQVKKNWSTIPPLNIAINTLVEMGSHFTHSQVRRPTSVAFPGAVVNPVVCRLEEDIFIPTHIASIPRHCINHLVSAR